MSTRWMIGFALFGVALVVLQQNPVGVAIVVVALLGLVLGI